jgi:flavin-dependent dehydrogenase
MSAFDAVVIGGGPAGAAAAIRAAQLGRSVCLVDRSKPGEFKIGESLPPAATRLLNDLGASSALLPGIAEPSFGNRSAWGGPELRDTDFIRDPAGHGWHVDRARFDPALRVIAANHGARVCAQAEVSQISQVSGRKWQVRVGEETVESSWVIDCAGRASSFARSQSVRRKSFDKLMAVAAEFASADQDSRTLVESAPGGWWYTSLVPNGSRVVVFHTDAGSAVSRLARSIEGFCSLAASTVHVRDRLRGDRPSGRLRVVSAATSCLDLFHGPGWLAAGDAAMTFDPLSSQGIYTALYGGMKAAEAMDAALRRGDHCANSHTETLDRVFDTYIEYRHMYYAGETRWPKISFWRSRQ